MHTAILASTFSVLTLLTGAAMADTATISGSAGYRERIALLPGSILEVSLEDVSRADVAAPVLSSQRYAMTTVPQRFTLSFDPDLIDERFSYSLSAKILLDEEVLFRTTSHAAVLTRGAGHEVDLMLTKMQAVSNNSGLEGTTWQVFEMNGEALGMETLPTLQFGDTGRVGAHAGCNRFSGGYDHQGDRLSFAPNMAGTMMACPPPYDVLEQAFLAALSQVVELSRDRDGLALVDDGGNTLLRMRPTN